MFVQVFTGNLFKRTKQSSEFFFILLNLLKLKEIFFFLEVPIFHESIKKFDVKTHDSLVNFFQSSHHDLTSFFIECTVKLNIPIFQDS